MGRKPRKASALRGCWGFEGKRIGPLRHIGCFHNQSVCCNFCVFFFFLSLFILNFIQQNKVYFKKFTNYLKELRVVFFFLHSDQSGKHTS